MLKDSSVEEKLHREASNGWWILLLLAGIGAAGYCFYKKVIPVIKSKK